MKHFLLLLFIVFVDSTVLNAQEKISTKNYLGCGFMEGNEVDDLCYMIKQERNFNQDNTIAEYNAIIDNILKPTGLPKNFIIQECDGINNALATIHLDIRYILYDPLFLNSLNEENQRWAKTGVLAHEIAHHLCGHTLGLQSERKEDNAIKILATCRKQELEADEWAGFILQKLGATIDQATSGFINLTEPEDENLSSHPSVAKRIQAVYIGFRKAVELAYPDLETMEVNAETKFNDGIFYFEKQDYQNAKRSMSESIELNNQFAAAYYFTGLIENALGDYNSAIEYYNKTLELDENYFDAIIGKSICTYNQTHSIEKSLAILSDYQYEISENAYGNCMFGILFCKDEQYDIAIPYLRNAIELEPNYFDALFYLALCYEGLNDYESAEELYSLTYRLQPENIKVLEKLIDACQINEHYDKALENIIFLCQISSCELTQLLRISNLCKLAGNFDEAIKVYSFIIEERPEDLRVRLLRAKLYFELGLINEGCSDVKVLNDNNYSSNELNKFNQDYCKN